MKAKIWFSLNLTAATFLKDKGPLSTLRQFPTTENPLKMMIKNGCLFHIRTFFALEIFKVLS